MLIELVSRDFDQQIARQTVTGAIFVAWLCGLAYFVWWQTVGRENDRQNRKRENKRRNRAP